MGGGYCCPYMKKCVSSGTQPCYYPIANCLSPCHKKASECSCKNSDFPQNWGKPTRAAPSNAVTTSNTGTAQADCVQAKSLPNDCTECQGNDQCQEGGYCYPYMKKCVSSP